MQVLFYINRVYRRVVRGLLYSFFTIFGLFITAFLLLQLPAVQNYVADQIVKKLSRTLNTEVSVDNIRIGFSSILLEGFYIEDQHKDTLLYSGQLNVKYHALKLLRKKIDASSISLAGAKVNIDRHYGEQDFNYSFILDAFASSGTDADSEKSFDWDFDIGDILLKDLSISYLDEPGAQIIKGFLPNGKIAIEKLNPAINQYSIDEIFLDKLVASLVTTEKIQQTNEIDQLSEEVVINDNVPSINPGGLSVLIRKLTISDAQLSNRNLNVKPLPENNIDFNDLALSNFQIQLENIELAADTIFATLNELHVDDKCGFGIEEMKASLRFSTSELGFSNLVLKTNNSLITDQIGLSFNSPADLNDLVNKVKFKAHFAQSEIAMSDIAYFIPGFNYTNETYSLDGEVTGRISNLKGKDLHIKYGDHTLLAGGFTMFGLPKINETFLDISIDNFETTALEFAEILPAVKLPANTAKLGKVKFQGNFAGFVNDFVAYGDLQTNLGFIRSDINMKMDKVEKIPQYSGNLTTTNFNIGKWLGEEDKVGNMSLNANINGKGFTWDKLVAATKGKIESIYLNGYNYRNVTFDGELQRRFFSGKLDIKDKSLDMLFSGTVDFQSQLPVFDLFADVKFARLKDLNLIEDDYKVKTKLHLDFVGSNINNVEGIAFLTNTEFYTDKKFYYLDTVSVASTIIGTNKKIEVKSGIVDGKMQGTFNTTDLPGSIARVINHYYPSLDLHVPESATSQDFTFNFDLKKMDQLTDLFLKELKIARGTSLSGKFNQAQHLVDIRMVSDFIQWNEIRGDNINLRINSQEGELAFETHIDKLALNKDLYAMHRVKGVVKEDRIEFNLLIQQDSLTESLNANAIFYNEGDSLLLSLLNSQIVFAGQQWEVAGSNKLMFYDQNIYADNLQFVNGDQEITIKTKDGIDSRQSTDLSIGIKNLDASEMAAMLNLEYYGMSGIINGDVNLNNLLSDARIFDGNISVADFHFNGEPLGELTMKGGFNPQKSTVNTEAVLDGKGCLLNAKGTFEDNKQGGNLNFKVNIARAPFNILEAFLTGVASDLKGSVTGNFNVTGNPDAPKLDGKLNVADASLKVDYLNSYYYFEPIKVSFNNNSIFINKTTMRDGITSTSSKAVVGGEITFTNFANLEFEDFYVYTEDKFRFMETTASDNEYFYGTAYGKGIILINGPFNDLAIYVNARTDPNTKIFIPLNYETSVSKYDFIKLIDKDADTSIEQSKRRKFAGLELTMDLDVTTDAEVQIIFDLQAGDIIKGRGEGNLNLNINAFGDFSMFGNYTIKEGAYLFTLQDIINKNFEIEEGGTIAWSGDPYEARLDINAIYNRKAARYDLVLDQSGELGDEEIKRLKKPVPVEVHLAMKGVLSSPDITFDILVPTESGSTLTSVFQNRLNEVKSDENELSKQVFGLIVFNRFMPTDIGGDPGLISGSKNTVTEFLTNQLNIYFNDWLSKYELEVNFDYRSYELEGEDAQNISRNELELELVKRVGRLYFNIGGNFDFGGSSSSYSNANAVAGDFSIEYSLREDGRIRVKVFRTSEYDIFSDAYRNKGGAGIFITKEFDNLHELLTNPDKISSGNSQPDQQQSPDKENDKVPDKDVVDFEQSP